MLYPVLDTVLRDAPTRHRDNVVGVVDVGRKQDPTRVRLKRITVDIAGDRTPGIDLSHLRGGSTISNDVEIRRADRGRILPSAPRRISGRIALHELLDSS